ncbi:serine/threonine-protein kinase [Amycolatopsis thermophila]|uniref:non-specific serine/threonine protein kinase n=1 Tax=Amycolatopsis thermophila TaxID=206084 RepID=A0ABU0F469_9PSEU|nr:serine/threonine-protein kinase [Amycolatopsis thermophila]MDQ0382383.1 tRNA A-37 threonylcarbamoyl transferase component Bud32 [Amycolatopsis thermophila]
MTEEQTQQTTPRPAGPRVVAGRYALLGELGRGGHGLVWRAQDQVIGRQVAIKELRLPDGAEDSVFTERVLREVRTAGRLNDPAIVTVFDVVSEDGATFIVMELVEAPTLGELVRRHGALPPQQVATIGQQVLSALRAAHDAGIVHRDVKPGNIMVGANGRVKLTDFGIATAIDDPRLTASGMIVGSPAFMAPERLEGHEAMPASDLWSLGATLFLAAEGVMAFDRPTTAATLHAIVNEVPYLTRVQGPLASAIMGLLVVKPEGRISYGQAGHLLGIAAHNTPPGGFGTAVHPGPAPTHAAPAPPRKSRRGLRITAGAVAGAVLLAGGFLAGQWWAGQPADDAMLPTMTYGDGGDLEFSATSSYACYNGRLQPGYNLGSDNAVDCDKSHELEVYDANGSLGNSSSGDDEAGFVGYPGADALRRYAESFCAMSFHSGTLDEKARGTLDYRALVPSQAQWEAAPKESYDDPSRTVYCLVSKRGGGQLTGSVTRKVR